VLVHGLGSSLDVWDPVVPALSRDLEVIAVDLPGFGRSASLPPGAARTVYALSDALGEWLGAQDLGHAALVGNSMGGWIALEQAARGRAPAVVAISPAGFGNAAEDRFSEANLRLQRVLTRALAPAAGPLCSFLPTRVALLAPGVARPWRMTPAQAAQVVRGYARAPGW